ncbi:MAG: Mrp/NBP35 family ATP-binding protein [Treponema sp.]|nr:Mrp/NBP35 family ATP-binding protein [Treponema sp.]
MNEEQSEKTPNPRISRVVGVASGKGGVGKSTIAVLLAQAFAARGLRVGILDADITGPSVPRLLGVDSFRAEADDGKLVPIKSDEGIEVMSINFLIDEETRPVIWRGPLLSQAVKQFWTDTAWGDLDRLVVDLPPGTSDVMLTALQSLPFDGLVFAATPQDFVSMIVAKAVHMAGQTNTRALGLVVNMESLVCPHCGQEIPLFSGENSDAPDLGMPILARIPWRADLARKRHLLWDGLSEEVRRSASDLAEGVEATLARAEAR